MPPEKRLIITIAIITFKRPDSLAETLRSLARIQLPANTDVKLLVVDNDAAQSARDTVHSLKPQMPFPVSYAVEIQPGIPCARNKALADAEASDYIAFIDDDDTADANWLTALLAAALQYKADVIKGRMDYSFPAEKEYLAALDIFAPPRESTGAVLPSAWTNNVLFSTTIYKSHGLRFDTAFTKTGGSDTHFFHCARKNGARIVMCNEAVVHTRVPEKRTAWLWLAQRNMRVGATLTISDIRLNGYRQGIRQALISAWDSLRYFFRLSPLLHQGYKTAIHPVMVAFFMLGRLAGIARIAPREYK